MVSEVQRELQRWGGVVRGGTTPTVSEVRGLQLCGGAWLPVRAAEVAGLDGVDAGGMDEGGREKSSGAVKGG